MSGALFSKIPRDFPRRYLDAACSFDRFEALQPVLSELKNRIVRSPQGLWRWLMDLFEVRDVLDETETRLSIQWTCHTDDPKAQEAYLFFLTHVLEPAKPLFHALNRKYFEHPARRGLDARFLKVFDRSIENALSLFREENIVLETQEEKFSQEYQKIIGAMTVFYDGKERTLSEMNRYLEVPARRKREEAWRLVTDRRLQEKENLDDLFSRMIRLRGRMAQNAGFSNYRDFAFRKRERFDYTPADCESFHQAVEKTWVPLLRRRQKEKAERLGLDRLRPWDVTADPLGLPPLRPFYSTKGLSSAVEDILRRVHPDFGENFKTMRRYKLLDLDSHPGKAPGGYNTTLAETRLPFIFMNAAGSDDDLWTLLHESGHAMHAFASREIAFSPYRHAPLEFCEVASMGMELLGSFFLYRAYPDSQEAARSKLNHLEDIVQLLPWVAQVDAFQHWLYLNPEHSPKERRKKWLELCARFQGDVDTTGLEEAVAYSWQRQLHLFEVPFYYIEYGIAQLGALQLWENAQARFPEAVLRYRQALSLGGSRTLPELFSAADLCFGFHEDLLKKMRDLVEKNLQALDETLRKPAAA